MLISYSYQPKKDDFCAGKFKRSVYYQTLGQMPEPTILNIAVPAPLFRTFDYLPPAKHPASLQPGMRIKVPFGRSSAVGVLLAINTHSELPTEKLKRATQILDDQPLLAPELLALLRWASSYYHYPLGETIATALPALLRQGEPAVAGQIPLWRLTPAGAKVDSDSLAQRAPRQRDALRALRDAPQGLTDAQLEGLGARRREVLNTLSNKGWITATSTPAMVRGSGCASSVPTLNPAQRSAVDAVADNLHQFQPVLLDGVTGSGKTEVYLQIIQQVVEQGRQALVLVPEITLTPQLVERFQQRFSHPMVVLHSGLSDRERLNAWLHAGDGAAAIVIGTRSAVFTPLARPGVMIIDEEHDPSLKQQTGLRYSARDLALMRARRLNTPVVLGSATPSLESLHNAHQGRYLHLRLPQRAGDAQPPAIRLVDVRAQAMDDQLSEPLLKCVSDHLARGSQVLLFLNRRGFAPTLICHECGWVAQCRRCDAHMTLHQRSRLLRCHHCGSQRPLTKQCGDCGSADLRALGHGTERIETVLEKRFPEYRIGRVDRDSTRRKGSMEALVADIHNGAIRILIGTQMLAKGHHFPNVTLVGILNGDQGLFGIDFRAGEHMAQMITQVSGRAGRGDKLGEVLIQTHHPDHELLQQLCHHGYHAYAQAALEERRAAALPPYTYLALLRAEANHRQPPTEFLQHAYALAESMNCPGIELYGPLPAPMERRAGKYRAQLLIQHARRNELHRLLTPWVKRLSELPMAKKVRWSVDVDPMDLL